MWTETLELCTAWSEGASLPDEKARKLRVLVPPQARPSLDEASMAANAGPRSMTIERWSPEGPLVEALPIPEPRRFPRVDAAALGRQLAQSCDAGAVLASGGERLPVPDVVL